MSNAILVIGESGTGKSTSIESLPPEKTFIINCIGKDLPFKGWKSKYNAVTKDNPKGNYFASDNPAQITRCLTEISNNRPDIEYIIIDDYIYTMSNEFMRRSSEKGFEKFSEIGFKAWSIVETAKNLRPNLNVAFLTHSEEFTDAAGIRKQKVRTIGKLIDEKVNLEGMFTIVLYTVVNRQQDITTYGFLTKNNGYNTGKTPRGMFEEDIIPNNLKFVFDKIDEYNL
jgi:hypothetical protein